MTVVLLRYYANITIFLRDYFVKRQKKYQEKQQKNQQRVKNIFVDATLYALLEGASEVTGIPRDDLDGTLFPYQSGMPPALIMGSNLSIDM